MKLIIFDFFSRWLLMVVLVFLFTLAMTAAGVSALFTPLSLICLLYDGQRGWLKVLRPLPVTVKQQAQAVWFIGVWLLPLVMLLAFFPAVQWCGLVGSRATNPTWFYAAVSWWVALGYGAFTFLLCVALPTRPPLEGWEKVKATLVSLGWGFSMPGCMILGQVLPKTPDAIQTWHWWLFASVPVWLWLSYVASPALARRRLASPATASTPGSMPEKDAGGGLTGLPLLIRNMVTRNVAIMTLMLLAQVVMVHFISSGRPVHYGMVGTQLPLFVLIFSSMNAESLNLRSLRMLPMSTAKLAGTLLSVPLVMSVAIGVIMTILSRMQYSEMSFSEHIGDPSRSIFMNFFAFAFSFMGLSSLLMVSMLHFNSGLRFLIFAPVVMVASLTLSFAGGWLTTFLLAGVAMTLLAIVLLQRGLRRSQAFYQPRRVPGSMGGHALGQPA